MDDERRCVLAFLAAETTTLGRQRRSNRTRQTTIVRGKAAIRASPRKREMILCQNCVTYSTSSLANTVMYGDTPMRILVAGSR
jgi:hypothetical protein